MLKAEDFVEIRSKLHNLEHARLQFLHSQVDVISAEERNILVNELLKIIENSAEALGKRILACNAIGMHQKQIELIMCKQIETRLRKVINDEFVVVRRKKLFRKKILGLKKTGPINLSFLQIILATLLRIDLDGTRQFVYSVARLIEDFEFRTNLLNILERVEKTVKLNAMR